MKDKKDNMGIHEKLEDIQSYEFDDLIDDFSDDGNDLFSENIFDDVDFDISLSGSPEETFEEMTVEDKLVKLSDELAEKIIIQNIMEQIDDNNFLYDKINYIDLFIEKYEEIFNDYLEPMEDQLRKELLYYISSNLIETVLYKIEEKFGVTLAYDLDNEVIIIDALKDLSTIYEFFVLRNKDTIVEIFLNDLGSEKIIEKFTHMLDDLDVSDDVFIKDDIKKGIDKRMIAVIHFAPQIVEELTTMNSTSLFSLMHRIINLDYYEEINMKMSDLLNYKFGDIFVIADHDEDAGKKFFGITHNNVAKSIIATEIINKFIHRLDLE